MYMYIKEEIFSLVIYIYIIHVDTYVCTLYYNQVCNHVLYTRKTEDDSAFMLLIHVCV